MTDSMWPLRGEQRALLEELAVLIARGGAWRFLHGPVVAADPSSYPDEWDARLAGVARLVGRTLWHAHLPVTATVTDVRTLSFAPRGKLLRSTALELVQLDGASALLEVSAIGNDDVAGIIAHEVGRVAAGWLARDGGPFRTAERELPTRRTGSIAAVYLGLGVVAANAAHHDRTAGEVRGRNGYLEHVIAHAGGLTVDEIAFLLAVQAVVRDDVMPALDGLRPTQAELVAGWRARLDDHEAALAQLLGLAGEAASAPVPRPDAPAQVVVVANAIAEDDLAKGNLGKSVYRYPGRRAFGRRMVAGLAGVTGCMVLGMGGVQLGLQGPWLGAITLGVGFGCLVLGYLTTPIIPCCAACEAMISATATTCHGCGGTIVADIANPRDRLELEETGRVARKPRTRAEKLAARAEADAIDRAAAEAEAQLEADRRR